MVDLPRQFLLVQGRVTVLPVVIVLVLVLTGALAVTVLREGFAVTVLVDTGEGTV